MMDEKTPSNPIITPSSSSSTTTTTPPTSTPFIAKKKTNDSEFHKVAVLYCKDGCKYLEFPGCLMHSCLLTVIKGNGYMSCLACEEERKNQNATGNDNIMSMTCATDLCEPWSVACQHCNIVKAETMPWTIQNRESLALAEAVNKEVNDVTPHNVLLCTECKTAQFPMIDGRLTHNVDGKIVSSEEEKKEYPISHWQFEHYMHNCEGTVITFPIQISKLEGKFCGTSLPQSPALPINTTMIPGFIPPIKWVTGKAAEDAKAEEERRNKMWILAQPPLDHKNPVWRDRAFVGEFGDVFTRDTELEGGHMAPSIGTLEYVVTRILDHHRSWLTLFNDEDITRARRVCAIYKSGLEIAQEAKVAAEKNVTSIEEKDQSERNQLVHKLLVSWSTKIRAMKPGDIEICPGGWLAPKGGHAIMHIIERHADSFSFVLCNTGGGLPYHPSDAKDYPKVKYRCSLRFDNIPISRLIDDGFWFMFWRLQVVPSDDHSHHQLYEVLVPHLIDMSVAEASYQQKDEWACYRTPQRAGNCYFKSVLECFRYLMRRVGLSSAHCKQMAFAVRREFLAIVTADLAIFPDLKLHDSSDLPLIRLCTKQVAYAAIKEAKKNRLTAADLDAIHREIEHVESVIKQLPFEVPVTEAIPPVLNIVSTIESTHHDISTHFPGFDGLMEKVDESKFTGTLKSSESNPRIDFQSINITVTTLNDAIDAINQCVELCEALSKDDSLNAMFQKCAVIEALFTRVLPVPKPKRDISSCLWRSRGLLLAEQIHLLAQLHRLAKIYLASCLSIDTTNESQAPRIITFTCLLAVTDVVIRIAATDTVSPIGYVLNGAEGRFPILGINLNNASNLHVETLTAQMEIPTPTLATARGMVLEYFAEQEKHVTKTIFPYLRSQKHQTAMYKEDDATLQWVRDICEHAGYVIDKRGYGGRETTEIESVTRWLYSSQDFAYSSQRWVPQLVLNHPEFCDFRDIVFLFKLALVPTNIPSLRVVKLGRWQEEDVRMYWNYQGMPMSNAMVFVYAKAFDRKDILALKARRIRSAADPSSYIKPDVNAGNPNAAPTFDMMSLFGGGAAAGAGAPKAGPGRVGASVKITEEDVIHATTPPTFDDLLTVETSERLMAALTVPYLRIPLVVGFFSSKDRVDLLHDIRLQQLFSGALFEPGGWVSSYNDHPLTTIPAVEGRLGCPYGILINEILHSPVATMEPFITLLQHALSLDTGSFQSSCVGLILYVTRVAVRLESYLSFVLSQIDSGRLTATPLNYQHQRHYSTQLHHLIHHSLLRILLSWLPQAVDDIPRAVLLNSHIALVYHSVSTYAEIVREAEPLTSQHVIEWIGSLAYVMTWHSHGIGVGKNLAEIELLSTEDDEERGAAMPSGGNIMANLTEMLQSSMSQSRDKKSAKAKLSDEELARAKMPPIPEYELFDLMQRNRSYLVNWSTTVSRDTMDTILDSIVEWVHGHDLDKDAALRNKSGWTVSPGPVPGRYLSSDGAIDVNLQTATVLSHANHIFPVADVIARTDDFKLVFGHEPQHYALISSYENVRTYAVFGKSYTIAWWEPSEKHDSLVGQPEPLMWHKPEKEEEKIKRMAEQPLESTKGWRCALPTCKTENAADARKCRVCDTLKPVLSAVEKRGIWYGGIAFSRRYGSTEIPEQESWIVSLLEDTLKEVYGHDLADLTYSLFLPESITPADATQVMLLGLDQHTWKQVIVHRDRSLVQIYNFIEMGRSVYRSLVFSTDQRLSMVDLDVHTRDRAKPWTIVSRYAAGNAITPVAKELTFIITRINPNTDIGQERYIPARCMIGLIPSCFLDHFLFWQSVEHPDIIRGYPRDARSRLWTYALRIQLKQKPNVDHMSSLMKWEATVTQQIHERPRSRTRSKDAGSPAMTGIAGSPALASTPTPHHDLILLNLVHTPHGSLLSRLASVLIRIEDLSYIIAWGRYDSSGTLILVRVELPRLRLTFEPRVDPHGITRLFSLDHAGYYVTDQRDQSLEWLLTGIPNSILLANVMGDLSILVPNCPLHRPRVASCPFSTELVADRHNVEWLGLMKTRYYIYQVHISHTFLLTDTLASSVYLILLYLLSRNYALAFRLAETCELDTTFTHEENYVYKLIERTLHDKHPDAHAVRLKLYLSIIYSDQKLGWGSDETAEWKMPEEYTQYLRKLSHISIACRLSTQDEMLLIDRARDKQGQFKEKEIQNRLTYLTATSGMNLSEHESKRPTLTMSLVSPELEGITTIWNTWEKQVYQFFVNGWQSGVWHGTVCYNRPTGGAVTGPGLISTIADAIHDTTVGAQHKLGFLFEYDLVTGSCPVRLTDGSPDCSATIGRLLTQWQFLKLTKQGDDMRPGPHYFPYGVIALMTHPTAQVPPFTTRPLIVYSDEAQYDKGYLLHRPGNPVSNLMTTISQWCQAFVQANQTWKQQVNRPSTYRAPDTTAHVTPITWILPKSHDTACDQRQLRIFAANECHLSQDDIDCFSTIPLNMTGFLDTHLRLVTTKITCSTELPFDVSKHPDASSHAAITMLKRMNADMGHYAEQLTSTRVHRLIGLSEDEILHTLDKMDMDALHVAEHNLAQLQRGLEQMHESDREYMHLASHSVEKMANTVTLDGTNVERYQYILSRYSGQEYTIGLDYLTAVLISSQAHIDMMKLNPYLTQQQFDEIMLSTISVLLHVNRLGHLNRCLAELRGVIHLVQRTITRVHEKGDVMLLGQQLSLKSASLSDLIMAHRYYVDSNHTFDPRYLAFEYIFNIVLRQMQVELVNTMQRSARDGKSLVSQMIMGAGKTTVVGPLLCLMLADGKALVTQVVPSALLPMSRAVLRSRFTAIIPKRIHTLEFDRSVRDELTHIYRLYQKIEAARVNKGIVVTTATSLKSMMLKYVELLHVLESADYNLSPEDNERLKAKSQTADGLALILNIFRSGILIMDEVDLLLHPLKSELNFPVGARIALEPAPDRWTLPLHIIDALQYADTGYLSVAGLEQMEEAQSILNQIKTAIIEGRRECMVQSSPHFILLHDHWYRSTLKPLLASWVLLWLRSKGVASISEQTLYTYLVDGYQDHDIAHQVRTQLNTEQKSLLNLSYDWLNSYAPHVLSKINRVAYGLLSPADMIATENEPEMPMSRKLTAVPFLAKDVPSRSSEFAHPDVLIGLTALAYRIEGLRLSDLRNIMSVLKNRLQQEMGPEHLRPSSLLFDSWIAEAKAAHSRGARPDGVDADSDSDDAPLPTLQLIRINSATVRRKILSLAKFQLSDPDQMQTLYELCRKLPSIIDYYLQQHIYPTCMYHQVYNLSASGQELGGDILFGRRLGFSGTPSDLLPLELGSCNYERGSDGKVINVLTSSRVVSYSLQTNWSVQGLLRSIARADPPFHVLIDTGALITGMSNEEVAAFLLAHGLPTMLGVVFLDQNDQQQILLRSGGPPVALSQCGVDPAQRFTFYDQIHTTGIDIKHAPNARAVLTLGKDMTFRDYAQGAYRMRGIGVGQTIHLYVIPEVQRLMEKTLSHPSPDLIINVAAWLTVNSMRMEKLQFLALCLQNLHNVWRKKAFAHLLDETINPNRNPKSSYASGRRHLRFIDGISKWDSQCVDLFRNEINFMIESNVPKTKPFFNTLKQLCADHVAFLKEDWQLLAIGSVLTTALTSEGSNEGDRHVYDREMVNEQEREQEQQKQIQVEKDPRAARSDEKPLTWKLSTLTTPYQFTISVPDATRGLQPFYQLSAFSIQSSASLDVPDYLLISQNYHKQLWGLSPHEFRRLKDITVILEWVPDATQIQPSTIHPLTSDQQSRVHRIFQLFDVDRDGVLNRTEIRQLLSVLGKRCHEKDVVTWLEPYIEIPPFTSDNDIKLDETSFTQLIRSFTVADINKNLFAKDGINNKSRVMEQEGRYFVIIPLVEAETLRRVIHTDTATFVGASSIALRTLDGRLLDYTRGYTAAPPYQQNLTMQTLRFINGDMFYKRDELRSLLRGISESSIADRREMFQQSLACRHRDRRVWTDAPVSQVFTLTDEFHQLTQRALIVRIRSEIRTRHLSLLQAFEIFDCNANGVLDVDELWTAVTWLGLDATPRDVSELMHNADRDKKGFISFAAFSDIFDDHESRAELREDHERHPSLITSPPLSQGRSLSVYDQTTQKRLTCIPIPPIEPLVEHKSNTTRAERRRVLNQQLAAVKQQQQQQQAQQQAQANQWSCPQCTYMNAGTANSCVMCASAKPFNAGNGGFNFGNLFSSLGGAGGGAPAAGGFDFSQLANMFGGAGAAQPAQGQAAAPAASGFDFSQLANMFGGAGAGSGAGAGAQAPATGAGAGNPLSNLFSSFGTGVPGSQNPLSALYNPTSAPTAAAAPPPTVVAEWSCSACTYRNPGSASSCSMCGTRRS